jgi:hypothetical protein
MICRIEGQSLGGKNESTELESIIDDDDLLCGLVAEFLATDPEARVQFPALPEKK